MGIADKHDRRKFEHLAKVDRHGVVVATVELAEGSSWESWTDGEGSRYVYLSDLLGLADVHGLQLLPPAPVTVTAVTHQHAVTTARAATTKKKARR